MFNHQDQWHRSINRLNRLNQKVEKTVTFLDCIGQIMTLFSRHNVVIIMRSKSKGISKKELTQFLSLQCTSEEIFTFVCMILFFR